MKAGFNHRPGVVFLAALAGALGVWLFVQRVLVPYQIEDAAAHDRPRGNLSDLYPRWLGSRELLLRGRDPYSDEVTREIQQGYYGRALDPSRPGDPIDRQEFVYPVYVAFCLAPTVMLPFEIVRTGFFWALLVCAVASILLWLRVLRWALTGWSRASLVVIAVGSLPVVQGLKLQQITLLVAALVAAGIALMVRDHPIASGVVLAISTIKPQLVWLLLVWLLIWTLADWRHRYRWGVSFLVTMIVLLAASAYYLPHWIPGFIQAMRDYRIYTDATPLLEKLLPSPWGVLARVLAGAATLHVMWANRSAALDDEAFSATAALVLAVTIIVIPGYNLYNQLLLLPAVLLLLRKRRALAGLGRSGRWLLAFLWPVLVWPWLASAGLALASLVLPLKAVENAWTAPFWTVLPLAPLVAGLMLLGCYRGSFAAPDGPASS